MMTNDQMSGGEHDDDCFLSGGDDGAWPCICSRTPSHGRVSGDGLDAQSRDMLTKAADAYEGFVAARNAMNAARPAIDATLAERALYDERYKADHAAEREHWETAISLAQCARLILSALSTIEEPRG